MKKWKFAHFLARFWKTIILGFLGFIFNIHKVQNEDSALRQFCNPVLDRDRIIKSSAYKLILHRFTVQKDQIMYFQTWKVSY